MNNGFIYLWRKLRDSPIYSNSKAVHIWVECLMRASYKGRKFYKGRDKVELEPGQFIMGYQEFGDSINIPASTVHFWLKEFAEEGMVERKSNAKGTIVTIKNWDDYQNLERQMNANQTTDECKPNGNRTLDESYNKDNKVKNDNTSGDNFAAKKKSNGRYEYPDEYEKIYDLYPKNNGTKKAGHSKWKARRKDGVTQDDLVEAVKNYTKMCDLTDKEMTYIKHIETFLGPKNHWEEFLDENFDESNYRQKKKKSSGGRPSQLTESDKEAMGLK